VEVAQWENVCPACAKPWVQFPSITKKEKKKVKKISGINVTSAIVRNGNPIPPRDREPGVNAINKAEFIGLAS
jgi:hypothetical protein